LNPIKTLFPFILLSHLAGAQSVSTLMGARGAGLGYSSATLSDEWSLHNNVAGLAKVKQISAAFAYDIPLGITGGNRMAAAFAVPFKTGAAGFGIFRFGDELYSEQIISAGLSNQFGLASLGLKFSYVQYRAESYGTKTAFSLSFGGIAQITPQISVGAYIVNLNSPKLSSSSEEHLPVRLVAGISFRPTEKFRWLTEVEKDIDYNPTLKSGMEYLVHRKISFRGGLNLSPWAGFLGCGMSSSKIRIDYALQYSNLLSLAHQASVIILMLKSKNK
jgi:hypothetical protein